MNMFTTKKLALASLVLATMGASGSALAASATGTANATVLAPIAISAGNTLEFGSFSPVAGGTVVIAAADGARSVTGGVVLVPGGTIRAGTFSVTGTGTQTFAITYPSSVNLSKGGDTMALQVAGPATGTLAAGAATINVGGTLTVALNQPAGAYAGTYSMTVEYN
jgi:hypothetical protein